MNIALELKVVLRACSDGYVGLWEVRRVIFYLQVDGVESPEAEEREEMFQASEKFRTKELTVAAVAASTLLEKKLVQLLQCREPDGEMTEVTDQFELLKILAVETNFVQKPEPGSPGYYLTITEAGEKALETNSLTMS